MANDLDYILRLNTAAFSGPLRSARSGLSGFTGAAGSAAGGVGSLTTSLRTLGTTMATVAGPLLAAFGAFKGIKAALGGAAEMESLTVAFNTLIGDATKAKTVLDGLRDLGAKTPFEFPELAAAGRSLIAFGEDAGGVVETLRRIGDVASGVQAPIGDIAEIYGKARVQNQLFAEDINQLTGRGIPIIGEFAKILGTSESEIKKLASEGKITFPLLEQAFRNLTGAGGKFAGMMQQQSGTMIGLWSTLKDAINEAFRALGQPINDALKPILQSAINLAGQLGPVLERMGQVIAPALAAMHQFVTQANAGGSVVTMLGERLKAAFVGLGDLAMVPLRVMVAGLPQFAAALLEAIRPAGVFLGGMLQGHALRFASALVKALSTVMQDVPGMEAAGIKLGGRALGLEVAGFQALADAQDAVESLPESLARAAEGVANAMVDMKAKLNSEMARFNPLRNAGPEIQGPPDFLQNAAAGGLAKAIEDATAAGAKKGTAEGAKAAASGGGGGGSALGVPARLKLSEGGRIQGFSRKANGLMDFGGLAEYDGLQKLKAMGVKPGERFSQRFGGLPRADGVEPPGTKVKRETRREADERAARAAQPRWDLVEAIDRRLAGLGLA